jgi:UDPglucose--hexose-1-phosphate uridylyltransferase
MHRLTFSKPDGRELTLYSRMPLDPELTAPSPFPDPLAGSPELRWHPLRGEWVTYAAYRQDRTFLPPPEYNPLAPTTDPAYPTELPAGNWEVAVFDNRFPSLAASAAGWAHPDLPVAAVPATGHCEVTVYTQNAHTSLGLLPLGHLELLLEVWGDRTDQLARRGDIAYVLPFENRGVEVGATLHHPHGQTYAYPVVPPVPARMLAQGAAFLETNGQGPLERLIADERRDGRRMLYDGPRAVAFVPACARYPYEAWVAPTVPVGSFAELDDAQRADLARALKTLLLKYDGLWQRPMPYVMAWYQAPTDGRSHPGAHLHAELYPPYRTRDRLKFLAGTEIAAGFFAVDALPEEKARELQQVEVTID